MKRIEIDFETVIKKTGASSIGLTIPKEHRDKFEQGSKYEFYIQAKKVVEKNGNRS